MKQRIQALDGLRFLASLGILWTHSWNRLHNPKWLVGRFDLANILAIGVNGVDLFFVISGFCMYYFYGSKPEFTITDFFSFLKKRWLRLSPVFYFATFIFCFVKIYIKHLQLNILLNVLHSIFYLNFIGVNYNTELYFWTLTVEWQFYLTIPFLMLFQNKYGFSKVFSFIFGGIFLTTVIFIIIVKNEYDFLTYTFMYRAVEFGCGVLVARILLKKHYILKNRVLWLCTFFLIIFIGRFLVSKQGLSLSVYYFNLIRLAGFTFMAVGFAGIVYLSITSTKYLHNFLGNQFFCNMGKVAYSFYIWHGLVNLMVTDYILHHFPLFTSIWAPICATIIGFIILYPISLISYNYLEKPFMNLKRKKEDGNNQLA